EGVEDQVADVLVGERIEDVLAGPPAADDALGAQRAELLRDGGDPDPRGLGELGHAPLAVGEAIEDLQARDVPRGAEERRGGGERLLADRFAAHPAPSVLVRTTRGPRVPRLRVSTRGLRAKVVPCRFALRSRPSHGREACTRSARAATASDRARAVNR